MMYSKLGMKPVEAFYAASVANKCGLSGCMTNRKYASSYMSDDIKNFLYRKLDEGNLEVHEYFEHNQMTKL